VLIDAGEDASAPFLDDTRGEYELCAKPVLIDAGENATRRAPLDPVQAEPRSLSRLDDECTRRPSA
jgi:hypothetical protein